MGLAERRALKDFQDNRYPALKSEVDAAAGFDLPLEVVWDQLMKNDMSHLLADGIEKVFFTPLIAALRAIAVDDMGKEALKAGLKKVVIQNTNDYYSATSGFSFIGGTLTLDHTPYSNVDYINERTEPLTRLLEKGL